MWYETLPAVFIIGVSIYSINIVGSLITKAMYGHPSGRYLGHIWNRNMHDRDVRIDGNPYKTKGLDNIPDN